MLSLLLRVLLVVLVTLPIAGCAAVAGIFKAGFGVGIIVAAILVVGIFALMKR